jgi:hypothetical protein
MRHQYLFQQSVTYICSSVEHFLLRSCKKEHEQITTMGVQFVVVAESFRDRKWSRCRGITSAGRSAGAREAAHAACARYIRQCSKWQHAQVQPQHEGINRGEPEARHIQRLTAELVQAEVHYRFYGYGDATVGVVVFGVVWSAFSL